MKNIWGLGRGLNALALAVAITMTLSIGLSARQASAEQPPDDGPQPAPAAAPSAASGPANSTEQIVVTGTRIRAPNLTSDSPLTAVSAEEIKLQGSSNIDSVLNKLPQVTGDQNGSQSTYGTPGIATVNLRDLGPSRTLVLVDGNRLMPGDPLYPYADVNFIPPGLVQSVDVVTGGASAVYGSDAVAGVVNFKMKHDFQGVQVEQDFSAAQHENDDTGMQAALRNFGVDIPGNQLDGVVKTTSIIAGTDTPDGKGNVTGYFVRAESDPVSDASRDFSACGIATTSGTTHVCSGSSNNPFGKFLLNGKGSGLSLNPDGSPDFVPYSSKYAYDSQTDAYLQRQDLRYNAGVFAHYEISPAVDFYFDSMFMDDQTTAQLSPAGVYSGHIYSINCDNPLMSAAEAKTLCGANAGKAGQFWQGYVGYRFANPNAPRADDLQHYDYHEVLGTRGSLGGSWNYDISGQYSVVDYSSSFYNDVSITKAQNALLVKNVNGVPTCESAINGTDPSCVPINIFQTGSPAAAYNYVFEPAYEHGQVTEKLASGSVNGDLGSFGIQSPLAKNPVAVAFGAEYRVDAINMTYSQGLLEGDLASTASSPIHPTNGSIDVYDIFSEARVPIVEDKEWVKALTFDTGYRLSEYNLAGETNTYKLGLNYAPTTDVNFRGGFNRAVRAPNVVELFSPDAVTSASGNDTCAGTAPTASLAACEHSGVTPAEFGTIAPCSSGFCNALTGGNTALKPERANTYTIGAVFTPSMVRNLTGSVDYYNINVKDAIGTLSGASILSNCLATGNPFYCNLIHRNSLGTLAGQGGYVTDTNLNLGAQHTKGIDFAANYTLDLDQVELPGAGALTFGFVGTLDQSRLVEPAPGLPTYDCKGLFGPTCGEPEPMWRHTLRTSWTTPWDGLVSLNWRYIGGTKLDFDTTNKALKNGSYDHIDGRIPSYSYFDLSASQVLYEHYTLRFGVNNLFDKDPPLVDTLTYPVASTLSNANTYPSIYDTLGRVFFLNLVANF